MPSPDLSLVIPFYNEEANCDQVIDWIIKAFDAHGVDYELVPVDNGSRDKTGSILARWSETNNRIKSVTVPENKGYGWGILQGLSVCSGHYVGYVDGDLQVAPSDIIRVFESRENGNVDICKGKRIIRGDGWKRHIVSAVYNLFFAALFRCAISDINAKPKIMRHTCYERLSLESKDWFIDAEIIIKAEQLGMTIEEVPIDFRPREEGKSNVRPAAVLEFLRNLIVYRISGRR